MTSDRTIKYEVNVKQLTELKHCDDCNTCDYETITTNSKTPEFMSRRCLRINLISSLYLTPQLHLRLCSGQELKVFHPGWFQGDISMRKKSRRWDKIDTNTYMGKHQKDIQEDCLEKKRTTR